MDEKNNDNSRSLKHLLSSKLSNIFSVDRHYAPLKVALRISIIYIIMGSIWILLSDRVLTVFSNDIDQITNISMIKGIVYVFASGLIILFLIQSTLKKIKILEEQNKKRYIELKDVYDQLSTTKEFNNSIRDSMLNAYALHKILLDKDGAPYDYEYIDVNRSFEEFTGLMKEDIIGKTYRELIPNGVEDETNWIELYGNIAITGVSKSFESYTGAFDKWVIVNAFSPSKGFFATVFHDITALKQNETDLRDKNDEVSSLYEELMASEEELRQQLDELTEYKEELEIYQQKLFYSAHHDHLTGLPNRLCFYETIEMHLKNHPDVNKAIYFIDSDNFKLINDTMGHSYGDQLIKCVADRLQSLFGNNHSIFRIGGDEFIVLFNGYEHISEVLICARDIIKAFKAPFTVEESTIHTTVSVGISIYPDHASNINELMKCADIAMYKAKETGKSKSVLFSEEMNTPVNERMKIESHLRYALENNEFSLNYQPQFDLVSKKITGFEALIRWNSLQLGQIPPLSFIGIAEETRLIVPIGKWVIRNACQFLKNLHSKGYDDMVMAINVSVLQLVQNDFVDFVVNTLKLLELKPSCLELEITESVLMESYKSIQQPLLSLKKYGIRIALDDFGQGYSSLSYLKQLPINTLKIDKIFIDSISDNQANTGLAGTIISIGHEMGLIIVAEGVETSEQMEHLIKHKCNKIQGYLISRPVTQEIAVTLL